MFNNILNATEFTLNKTFWILNNIKLVKIEIKDIFLAK
jgi:hypothetical protein